MDKEETELSVHGQRINLLDFTIHKFVKAYNGMRRLENLTEYGGIPSYKTDIKAFTNVAFKYANEGKIAYCAEHEAWYVVGPTLYHISVRQPESESEE